MIRDDPTGHCQKLHAQTSCLLQYYSHYQTNFWLYKGKNSIQYDSYLYSNNFLSSESCKILSTHKYIISSSGTNTVVSNAYSSSGTNIIVSNAYSSSGTNIVVSNICSSSGTNFVTCYAHKFMWLYVIKCLSRI